MAEVALTVGGHLYRLACHDGEEPALRAAGRLLDERVSGLKQAMGPGAGEARLLLMAGLLLAGERLENAPPATVANPQGMDPQDMGVLDALVERMEKLAHTLERAADAS